MNANRANPVSDLLANFPRSLLVSGRLATLIESFSFSICFCKIVLKCLRPCKCKSTCIAFFGHLLDPGDVGNLPFEPRLNLASGQGERHQQEDNLLL